MSAAQRQPQQGRAASGHPSHMAQNAGPSKQWPELPEFAHAAGSGSGSVWLSPSPLGPLHRRPRTRSAISSAPAENPLKGRLFFACATERANWRQEASQ
ncbi:hypothetical protein PC129_g19705 [Phytophthora cactorum]|uniref:Uncharacterized protein n=1 Tax=Phytophthora cactorum TaxID=29920 RepID=A0A8T1HAL8_9STRA|nr:hypothetical protein Pcac1_g6643 [Phytophthora cactorum]KAG2798443.1 hypothetical protein PC111_g20852 [Phytophthora cactorum]KAG2798565.1 hypothetical protein PC112_g21292 [Phytophthora cactorum]KAG2829733.1 hypothetical protein PC113_g21240 [Phytophthora cactorum]KAG2877469.1 hypothetical protein PC114_g23617 [Phytophthora cactorum]